MRILLDLDEEKLVASSGFKQAVNSLTFRRSAEAPLTVQTVRNGAITDLGTPLIYFIMKNAGEYDQDPPLLLTSAFTKTGSGSSAEWNAVLNFITTTLNAAFVVDGDESNDEPTVTAMGELVVDDGTRQYRSQRLSITIENNIYRGGETAPPAEPGDDTFITASGNAYIRPALTITNQAQLAAFPTNGIPRPFLLGTRIADNARLWLVRDEVGTETTDYAAGIVSPDDHGDSGAIMEAYL